jgi:hypothetical protein
MFGTPRIKLVAAPVGPQFCVGDNAITLSVTASLKKAFIPLLDGLKGWKWFANLDGRIFREETPWVLSENRVDSGTITMSLPRSALSQPGFTNFEIQSGATVYMRATPEIFPWPPYSMFAKAELTDLFSIGKFQCCDDSDCSLLYGVPNSGRCTVQKTCQKLFPTPSPPFKAPVVITGPKAPANAAPTSASTGTFSQRFSMVAANDV